MERYHFYRLCFCRSLHHIWNINPLSFTLKTGRVRGTILSSLLDEGHPAKFLHPFIDSRTAMILWGWSFRSSTSSSSVGFFFEFCLIFLRRVHGRILIARPPASFLVRRLLGSSMLSISNCFGIASTRLDGSFLWLVSFRRPVLLWWLPWMRGIDGDIW